MNPPSGGSGVDWGDVKGIIIRQGGALDWRVIRSELPPLCELKEAPEIPDELEKLRTRLERG